MGQAIGDVLPLAVGVAISPIPIVAVVLMLATPKGHSNGPAFVAGWLFALVVVGTAVLLIAGAAGASSGGQPKTWVSVLKLLLGIGLLLLAVRQWRSRPRGDSPATLPGWMKKIDTFTPPKAAGLAALLAGPNPKNLFLVMAAGAAIAQAGIPGGQQAIVLVVFVVIATLGPGIPVGIYCALGSRSEKVLASLRGWMIANNQAIMSVLFVVFGAKLIGDSIGGFSS